MQGVASWRMRSLFHGAFQPTLPKSISTLFTAVAVPLLTLFHDPNLANADLVPAPWNDKILYEVVTPAQPNAAIPKAGDLVAIRFKASYNGQTIDDTLKTSDPYYYRCGVGTVVQGLDQTVLQMHEGERVKLRFGGDLAFGERGMKSAPGRARVPPNAVIDYEVFVQNLQ